MECYQHFPIVVMCLAMVNGVSGQISSTTRSPNIPWRKQDIPNPQYDIYSCGRNGKPSWVCDPDGILSTNEADQIDELIEEMRGSNWDCICDDRDDCPSGYGGYHAAVVILNKLAEIPLNPSSSQKREVADDYADFLRDHSWEFGNCNDDLVILVSKEDRIVFTKTGDSISTTLTSSCVDKIFEENKDIFTNGDFERGIFNLIDEYKAVFAGERKCNSDSWLVIILVCVFLGGALIAVFTCFVCRRMGHCQGGGSSGGGNYRSHGSPARRYSAASASSGGGGGEF